MRRTCCRVRRAQALIGVVVGEFELIRRYFVRPEGGRSAAAPTPPPETAVRLGIGDDCALLAPRAGFELAISTDMLVAGRHFLVDTGADALGWKSLAVNLSDLAAMGAQPLAFTLALALPEANPDWLEGFSRGLFECADRHGCTLIGGDTTRGPLNICITVLGEVPVQGGIRRDGARPGDDIWVSGNLGDAALGLRALRAAADDLTPQQRAHAVAALERPQPRVALGIALRGIATAMLDLSDGLLGDLGHMLAASGQLGAVIDVDALPLSFALRDRNRVLCLEAALAGGDDYELCFTANAAARSAVQFAAAQAGTAVSRIGFIDAGVAIRLVDGRGMPLALDHLSFRGYDHFA